MSTVSVESESAVWTGVFTLAFTSGVKTRIRGEIPWLRLVAGRIRHIAGREPFECHCIGLSTVREPVAHAAMRKCRIRSEWFHWCPETQQYGADTCDLCWIPRDGEDSFERVIELANELDHERNVDDLARRLHAIHLQLQQP